MPEKVLTEVTKSTSSELILFFVLVVVVVIAIAVPLYKLMAKSEKDKRELHFKREQLLMNVVKDNSTVISKLTTLIENNNQTCHECKAEQTAMMQVLLNKQEEVLKKVDVASAVLLDRKEESKNG